MARDRAPDPRRGDYDYSDLPPVGSPEFELLAREFWALPHDSPRRDELLGGRPMPFEFYRWL